MHIEVLDNLDQIDRLAWNRLTADNNPFLRHEFLSALERHQCVNRTCGWEPRHIVIYDDLKKPVAATPLYLKSHSYGEFVFDWAWADAYRRNGLAYYPKLVSAVPYTPMTGQRLLISAEADSGALGRALISAAIRLAGEEGCSSVHWLFPDQAQKELLSQQGLIIRQGCQYHWHNRGYESFDHYLSHFSSRKRKNIIKERRQVQQAGVTFRILHGADIDSHVWQLFHKFYREIYDRKWGSPSLTPGFFEEIGATLADQVVLVLAYLERECIAAALNLRSADTLYGRHWGCNRQLPGLHFETCYYQGLEYCIQHGLKRFEPGAQGEHKIARGFLPTPTWSAHWIAEPEFRAAIDHFCRREMVETEQMMQRLMRHAPFHKPE